MVPSDTLRYAKTSTKTQVISKVTNYDEKPREGNQFQIPFGAILNTT